MRPAFARFEFPAALDTETEPQWPLAATAQHVVLTQIRRLLSLRDAAWHGEAEAVRRLRVATRRARTALADFAALWDPDEVRAARRALGRLATQLGKGRDLDVALALVDVEIGDRQDAPALLAARAALRRRRLEVLSHVHGALRTFELAGWPARLVTHFAALPLDLWRFIDVQQLLRHDEGSPTR